MSSVVVSPPIAHNPQALAVSGFCTCDDMELVRGLLDNDTAAWRALNLRYGRLIQSCIGRVTARFSSVVRTDDGSEIYSMLCVQLLANNRSKLRSFDPERGCKLGTWLGMLATHTAYDFLRSIRKIPRSAGISEAEELAGETPDPAEVTLERERMRHMDTVLAGFTRKDREFVDLYFGEGLDPDEVARRMGISVKTVYSKKHKIQRRLESLLRETSLAA